MASITLPKTQLTASGRPVLHVGEVEELLLDQVDLEFAPGHPGAELYKGGYCILTNQRLIYMCASTALDQGASCWLPVHAIQEAQKQKSLGLPPKVRLYLDIAVTGPEHRPVPGGEVAQGMSRFALRCRGGAPDALRDRLLQLRRGPPPPGLTTAAVGSSAASGPLPPPPPPQAPEARAAPAIDEALLAQVVEMGFPRNRTLHALLATHNAGAEAAMDWLLAYGDSTPGVDDVPEALRQPGGAFANPLLATPTIAAVPPFPGGAVAQHAPGAGGVAAIVRREQAKAAQAGQSLGQAFHDLSALMVRMLWVVWSLHSAMAGDMVKLAERFRGVATSQEQLTGQGGEDLVDPETQLALISLGLASPVTKQTAGSRYMTELSRQLADFLVTPLAKAGGQMSLPDVYCLYNRARGTELVSPDDLLMAVKTFSTLSIPLRLRTYPSGVAVVQGTLGIRPSERLKPPPGAHWVLAWACTRDGNPKALSQPKPPCHSSSQTPGVSKRREQVHPCVWSDEASSHTDEHVAQRLKELTSPSGTLAAAASTVSARTGVEDAPGLGRALGAHDVACHLGISVTIAKEHLLMAEQLGVLCRDDGPEGLRFYRNFFMDASFGLAVGT